MYRPDPQITPLQKWVRVINESQATVRFYPADEINAPEVLMKHYPAIVAEYVEGYGVRAEHSDITPWNVFPTQVDADLHFEYLADGFVFSSEAA